MNKRPLTPAQRKRAERARAAEIYKRLGLTPYKILRMVLDSPKSAADIRRILEGLK
jgi:hypothetical protein